MSLVEKYWMLMWIHDYVFILHIYERQLLDNSFSLPSASDEILQNILVKYKLTMRQWKFFKSRLFVVKIYL